MSALKNSFNTEKSQSQIDHFVSTAGYIHDSSATENLLQKNPALINEMNNNGVTALAQAAGTGHKRMVKILLDHGANVHAKNPNGNTALISAAWALDRNGKVISLLLEHGARIDEKNAEGYTALMWAASNGQDDNVRLLLQEGADVELKNIYGATALKIAQDESQFRTAKILQEWAEKQARGPNDSRPALSARFKNLFKLQPPTRRDVDKFIQGSHRDHEAFKTFISAHPQYLDAIGTLYNNGETGTALMFTAADYRGEKWVRLLLEKGASVDIKNSKGMTALMFAAQRGYEGSAKLLLDHKASINETDSGGMTPLMHAARYGLNTGIIKLLLEAGADAGKKEFHGNTALDIARKENYPEVAALLEQWAEAEKIRLAEESSKRAEQQAAHEAQLKKDADCSSLVRAIVVPQKLKPIRAKGS